MWSGWALQDILDFAGPSTGARFLHLFGRDGYARSVPIERVHRDAMLVASLRGHHLAPDHGAPWRAFFPGWYGMDSVKWLERIVVASAPLASNESQYVEMRPAVPVGVTRMPLPRLQIKSLITSPLDGNVVHSGAVELRGLAWCGEGAVAKVEFSTDGGKTWNGAELSQGQSRYEWAAWRAVTDLRQAGSSQLICRASDTLGRTQPEQHDPERLDGYAQNWYHRISVVVT